MEAISRNIETLDTITLLLIFSLALITSVRYFYKSRFSTYLILPMNNKYVSIYNKKKNIFSWFHGGNLMFQFINFSVFGQLVARVFGETNQMEQLDVYIIIGLGLVLFFLFKMMLQFSAAFVFDIQHKITELIFNKQSYFNYSAFVAFVANIFLVYVRPDSKPIIYVAAALIVFINLACIYTLVKVNQNVIRNYFVYFILYLCALEIAPLVIFGSYLKG